jgi:hypothetical protein
LAAEEWGKEVAALMAGAEEVRGGVKEWKMMSSARASPIREVFSRGRVVEPSAPISGAER